MKLLILIFVYNIYGHSEVITHQVHNRLKREADFLKNNDLCQIYNENLLKVWGKLKKLIDQGKSSTPSPKQLHHIILMIKVYLDDPSALGKMNNVNESVLYDTKTDSNGNINKTGIIEDMLTALKLSINPHRHKSPIHVGRIVDIIVAHLKLFIESPSNEPCRESNMEDLLKSINFAYQLYLNNSKCLGDIYDDNGGNNNKNEDLSEASKLLKDEFFENMPKISKADFFQALNKIRQNGNGTISKEVLNSELSKLVPILINGSNTSLTKRSLHNWNPKIKKGNDHETTTITDTSDQNINDSLKNVKARVMLKAFTDEILSLRKSDSNFLTELAKLYSKQNQVEPIDKLDIVKHYCEMFAFEELLQALKEISLRYMLSSECKPDETLRMGSNSLVSIVNDKNNNINRNNWAPAQSVNTKLVPVIKSSGSPTNHLDNFKTVLSHYCENINRILNPQKFSEESSFNTVKKDAVISDNIPNIAEGNVHILKALEDSITNNLYQYYKNTLNTTQSLKNNIVKHILNSHINEKPFVDNNDRLGLNSYYGLNLFKPYKLQSKQSVENNLRVMDRDPKLGLSNADSFGMQLFTDNNAEYNIPTLGKNYTPSMNNLNVSNGNLENMFWKTSQSLIFDKSKSKYEKFQNEYKILKQILEMASNEANVLNKEGHDSKNRILNNYNSNDLYRKIQANTDNTLNLNRFDISNINKSSIADLNDQISVSVYSNKNLYDNENGYLQKSQTADSVKDLVPWLSKNNDPNTSSQINISKILYSLKDYNEERDRVLKLNATYKVLHDSVNYNSNLTLLNNPRYDLYNLLKKLYNLPNAILPSYLPILNNTDVVELTYLLQHPNILLYQPQFLIKHKIPYDKYLSDINSILNISDSSTSRNTEVLLLKAEKILPNTSHELLYTKSNVKGPLEILDASTIQHEKLQNNNENKYSDPKLDTTDNDHLLSVIQNSLSANHLDKLELNHTYNDKHKYDMDFTALQKNLNKTDPTDLINNRTLNSYTLLQDMRNIFNSLSKGSNGSLIKSKPTNKEPVSTNVNKFVLTETAKTIYDTKENKNTEKIAYNQNEITFLLDNNSSSHHTASDSTLTPEFVKSNKQDQLGNVEASEIQDININANDGIEPNYFTSNLKYSENNSLKLSAPHEDELTHETDEQADHIFNQNERVLSNGEALTYVNTKAETPFNPVSSNTELGGAMFIYPYNSQGFKDIVNGYKKQHTLANENSKVSEQKFDKNIPGKPVP